MGMGYRLHYLTWLTLDLLELLSVPLLPSLAHTRGSVVLSSSCEEGHYHANLSVLDPQS